MGNKCFLCGLTYIVGGEVSVHRLPSNQLEREKWLQRISWNEPLLEKKIYYLCSNHFPEDCFRFMNLRKRLIPGSLPSPFEIKLEIPPTYSEGNRGIEEQESTESFSKKQSPLGFGTSTTFYSPSKCASSSSSNSENLGMSLIQGGLPSAIKMEIPEEIPLTCSEGNGSIEEQDSTESDSKTQSPLRFGTSTTVNSPSKCASSSSSNTENLGNSLLPSDIKLEIKMEIPEEIPMTYSEENRSIEKQDSTESDSKTQSPLRFGTSTTVNSPSKCASSSSSNTENLGNSLIQGDLPSDIKLEIKMEIPEEIPMTCSEENRSIEKQESPLRYGTSTTFNCPSKCTSFSSSDTENLRESLIQGGLPSAIKLEIPEELPLTYSEENGSVEEQDYTEYLSDSNMQSPSKKKLRCDTPTTNDSEETLTSTSPACASCSSSNSSKKRFFSNPRYIGDYTPSHLENPMLREKYFWLTQRTLSDLRIKNKILANQVRRLKLSLKTKKLMENNRHILPVRDEMENAVNLTIAEPTKVVIFLNQ